LIGGFSVFHSAKPDLSEVFNAGFGKFCKIFFDHAVLNNRCARVHFHARGAKILIPALCRDGHSFKANNIFGTAGHVDFAGGNHCRHPPMQGRVNPVKLLLARCVITDDRMHMAVNEAGGQGDALGINDTCRTFTIKVVFVSPCLYFSVN
jgi:hypothetical protein